MIEYDRMSGGRPRHNFIDVLRFVAAFFMIQGHVFDALLSPQIKSHPAYYMYDFFHGFVAPAFLFAAGVAYGVSTMQRWEEHVFGGKKMRTRILRFVGLIAVGYALHLPYFSLRKTIYEASPAEILSLLQSDVLHCIGLTLLLLQIGAGLTKNRNVFQWTVAALALVVIVSAPLMWSAQLSGILPLALVSYLTPETGSWFPLFPWSAYILAGVLFGCVLSDVRDSRHMQSLMLKNAVLSCGVFLLAYGAMSLPFSVYPVHDFWKSNPTMFFVRLSAVSMVASCICVAEHRLGIAPKIASILGGESLFIYILHLVIVYGSVVNRGLAQIIGPTLQLLPTTEVVVAVVALITLITLLWYNVKTQHETAASWITRSALAAFVVAFVVRPW